MSQTVVVVIGPWTAVPPATRHYKNHQVIKKCDADSQQREKVRMLMWMSKKEGA